LAPSWNGDFEVGGIDPTGRLFVQFPVLGAPSIPATVGLRTPSLRDEAATESVEKKGDLKKQSQLSVVQLGAKSYLKREYENNPASEIKENKAKQSQTPAPDPAERAGKRDKTLAAATG